MTARTSYTPPAPTTAPPKHLLANADGPDETWYTFFDQVEIRRLEGDAKPGVIYVDDETISSQHCVISQTRDGRCFLRDLSRNGTRLDGRRLVPNIEVEFHVGQVLSVGAGTRFRLEGDLAQAGDPGAGSAAGREGGTIEQVEPREVTVLVGDIRDYTVLVREAPSEALQLSVSRMFEQLEREVAGCGGTVKEHQGDALFAFWEEVPPEPHAEAACRAALALAQRAEELARDPTVWMLDGFPLRMDWALATGPVVIHSFGGDHPIGLSVIGEPVVLAFRIEKLVTDETGPIVACAATRRAVGDAFAFESVGMWEAKGFPAPVEVFALRGPAGVP